MAAVYGEERVNYYTNDHQYGAQVAVLAGGGYVVSWVSRGQDGSDDGIYAQRYNSVGMPVGAEFRVNSATANAQIQPTIVGLSDGGFVVAWSDQYADGSSWGVFAQRYDAHGVARGSQFLVNQTTLYDQGTPAIAAVDGGFVVTWASQYQDDGGSYGVYARRYANDGSPSGAEFAVNSTVSGNQNEPAIAAFDGGGFVVVWRSEGQDGSGGGVYAQRFDAAGAALGGEFRVNTTTDSNQSDAHVAVLADGSFVVVWADDGSHDGSGYGVYAQRFDAGGNQLGGEFLVNGSVISSQYQPAVTALASGGFVVSWYNDYYDASGTGSAADVYVREYAADGSPVGAEVKVNSPSGSYYQYEPAIAHLGSDNFVVVWRSDGQDGSNAGIYQQLFGSAAELVRGNAAPVLADFGGTVSFDENVVNATPQVLDPLVSFSARAGASFEGGVVTVFYVSGASPADQLSVRGTGDGVGEIGVAGSEVRYGGVVIGEVSGGTAGSALQIRLNAAAGADAIEALVQGIAYANTSFSPLASRQVGVRIEDGSGVSTGGGVVTVNVIREEDGTPAFGGEDPVNTYTQDHQLNPAIGKLADGGYVIAWSSNGQDGSSSGIYAQRFSDAGVAVGPEVRVNSATAGEQSTPQVAGLSDGGYVIVWQDNASADGSGWGVLGQRFGADGSPAGEAFVVNTTTIGYQFQGAISSYAGGFAVVWASDSYVPGGDSDDIYLTRYDNAGNVVGTPEMRVSVNPGSADAQSGNQYLPRIAARANGDLVIVWRDDNGNDGSGYGVFGRSFDAASGGFGEVFQVTTVTSGNQYEPDVAMFADGSFVVVWRDDNGLDGSGAGTFGRRFDAAGAPQGDAFLVNENATGSQFQPKVTALSTGGFVVAFYNDTGDYWGDTYIREFDAAGNPVDSDRRVHSDEVGAYRYQYEPAITDLGNGSFVVAWRADNNADGSGSGIYQQVFGDSAALGRQGNPELSGFTGAVSFMENAVNGGLQIIDAAVSLSDVDSADFSGGRLDLYYLTGGAAEDQLGVVAGGLISVAGNVVSYAGTPIGTLNGGANGENLRIDLSGAAATADAVQALVQHLGYGNTDFSPNASRTLGLRISDGDGGTSAPNVLTLYVGDELGGTQALGEQEQVNTYTSGEQVNPAIGKLADGGYVIAWISNGQDGSGWGVHAQRFSAAGVAVGPEMQVNTATYGEQSYPQVAGLSDGGYVIVWQDNGSADSSGWGVFGQRFGADGSLAGGQFVVNTTTLGSQLYQAVASYTGGFAVAWSADGNVSGGNGHDIYLTRFDNAGNIVGTPEMRVSVNPGTTDAQSGYQYLPRIAARADGDLVIVWRDDSANDGSGHGVYGRSFDAASGSFGDVFLVNTVTSGHQYEPDVAMFADGSFVVVWRDDNALDGSGTATFGRRFDAAGVALGDAFLVNENTSGSQYQPKVTALSTGGFVVAFYNDTGDYWGDTYIREFDAAGNPVDSDRRVNADSGAAYHSQYEPAITDLGNGNFVVAWRADNNADGSASGIYQQVFGDGAALARQGDPDLSDFTGAVSFMENAVNGGLQVIDAAVSLSDADSADFSGGRLDLYYLSGGTATDQLGVVAGGPISVAGNVVSYAGTPIGTLSGGANGTNLRIDFSGAAATADAVQALVQRLGYANPDSSPNASRTLGLRVSDGDGGASAPNVLTITVTPEADGTPPAYPQDQVNTHFAGEQTGPAIGKLADGGYVIAWTSAEQDGSSWGIYAQRFSAAGVAVGPEVRVNTATAGEQSYPQVAGLSDGGYVITWQDPNGNDLSGWGVFAQRYDAAGSAEGSAFVVSTTTLGYQLHSVVASHDQGFVVAWTADTNVPGGNGYDIYLTRFDNAGNVLGTPEQRVSVSPGSADAQPGSQDLPRIAAHADGSMMIVWRDSNGNDGSGWGIFGRSFDAVSGSFGNTVQINSYTYSTQIDPDVAALAGGGYVVVWRDDNGRDGSGYATFAQRLDASGAPVGGEFRVNDNVSGNQYMAKVSALPTGGFVVAFYNDTGEYWGDTYIREFDAAGNPVDGDRRVNDDSGATYRNQYEPAIADLGNGNFVVAWRADGNADGSASGVFQQVFGETVVRPGDTQPVLDDLAPAVTFGVADMAAPQVIDNDLQVSANASLAGGSLWVYFTSGAGASDALSVCSEGSGAGQIGVSGSQVSHGGVVIGSIAGGSAGAPLVISLNANATAAAVRALAENISYQYIDASVPAGTTRSVAYRLFDGAGMASASQEIAISLAASAPTASLALDEFTPVVNLTESQSRVEMVLDGAVSLVQGAGSLDGAELMVSFVGNGRPSDELGIVADGSGAGQVDVSGANEVSYEGTVIGRMSGGEQGSPMFVEFNAAASAEAVEAVIEHLSYQSTTEGPLASRALEIRLTDASGAATASTVTINITPEANGAVPLAGQERVNTYLPGDQTHPVVATLADGSYVVVWQSNGQDGSYWGVHGQHFTAAGVPIGAEFQVNSYTTNSQSEVAVTALAGGGFVVAWRSENQDSSSGGVFAQVFSEAAERLGAEFRVNTASNYDQTHAAVVGLADGSFVVAFADQVQDGSSYGSFAQRYDAGGNALGSYFQLNTYTAYEQYLPALAALRDDPATAGSDETGFVAVWRSQYQDGSGAGIFGQRFNAAGEKLGSEFQVNTNLVGNQYSPTVATLANGDFVVVWSDESDASVRGQRYTAGGAVVGGEFVINTPDFPSNHEQYPQIAALANGGFVVAWDAYYNVTVGDYYNVWAQQFDGAGNKVDGPLLLSDSAAYTQIYPAITGLTGGGFVAAWANTHLDQPGVGDYGVYQRLFGTAGAPERPLSPQLLDLESEVSFAENAVNAAPQLLDPGLRVVEGASPSFNGGVLTVAVLQGYGGGEGYDAEGPGQDVFTILHEGNGAGQVGVAGAVVSFGGVQVGTLEGGQNGLALQVHFNAAATAEIVEQVAERLAYRNVSSAPVTSRLVEVVVSDGHGGQSAARTITVNVAAETDGGVPLLAGDTRVNTYTTDSQIFPTVIHLSGPSAGQYVVIWQSNGQDSDGYGVFAQRYDSNGAAIGPEFQVSTTTPGNQGADSGVRAAALADGGFVVAWEAPDGWSRGIFAQRFDATGTPAGSEWRVNPAASYDQLQPTLTGLADGGFVIAYTEENADGNSYGTLFVRYDAAGVAQGAPVLINENPVWAGTAFTDGNQSFPQLAALAGGGFVATWHSNGQDGSAWGIYARLFDADGAPVGDSFQVHTTALGSQERPDVATLANGDFVIVWTSDNDPGSDAEGVFMQRFTAAGVPVGAETLVNNGSSASHYDAYARVTALDTGGFVVAWEAGDDWGRGFYIQQYDAAGSKVDGPQRVSQNGTSDQSYGDVEGLPGGRFVVAWSATNDDAAGAWGIYQNVYGAAGSALPNRAPELGNVVASVGFQENSLGTPQLIDTAIGLFDGDSPDFAGGRLTVSVISGYSSTNQDIGDYRADQDNFSILDETTGGSPVNVIGSQVRVGATVIGTLVSDGQAGRDLVIEFNASATQPLVERVIERLAYRNPSSDPVASRQVSISLSDGDGATSTPQVVQIVVAPEADGAQPLGQPELVNTYQTSEQLLPAAATLADGGYVIVWQSAGEDGWDNAIVGQRYAANGTPVGNEFKVNAYTPGAQTAPAVTGLADGGWVVTYTDQWRDGSGYSVWAQRFDAAGSPAGAEFRVNSSTSGSQYDSAVSALGDGFVVAWFSDGERSGEYYDIFFQRYDASGVAVGVETRANQAVVGNPYAYQFEPAITGLANGNIVVTWRSEGQDGSNSGVYARLFDGQSGNALGTEFQLNQYTTDYQYAPRIAAVGGGFVATWVSRGQDGSGDGIYARRYDAAGNALGDEFRVNEASSSEQRSPDIAATGDGGFVITWRNYGGDEVYAQKFDATGARVDGQIEISSAATYSDDAPVVAGLAGNAFAIAWQGYYDNNSNGIFQRVVGEPQAFAHSAAPQIVDLASSVSFQENALNAAPQLIDAGIGLLDVDSTSFAGGRLDVSFLTTYGDPNQYGIPGLRAQDQLGIRHQGMATEQIGVLGNTVYFGGTAIGTITGNGANGGSLVVSFNANATPNAVEHLIENLTYQNFLSNPEPSRTVSLRLADGSGGVTAPLAITLDIVANPDGAVMYGAEQVVSRVAGSGNQAGDQANPVMAMLDGGGYVVAYTDTSGLDGNGYGIFARRYDANDNPLGDPFQVNLTGLHTQDEPAVVRLSGGGFAVVWTSNDYLVDNSGDGVFMRRYLADGSPAPEGEVLVNTSISGNQYQPAVSQSQDGGFIVAWYSDGERDGSYYDVFFQRFDASGNKLGIETRASTPVPVNPYIAEYEPAIALLNDSSGDFVITWTDNTADGSASGIFGQRFNADGSADGASFRVNTYTDSSQGQSAVAALGGGAFVVVWASYGQDGSYQGIYGQRFDGAGTPAGAEFRVNYSVSGDQIRPAVTGLTNGGFVVTWDDYSNVWLQQYDASGRAIDSQVPINNVSTEYGADVVATADGGFLVAYTGYRDTAHGGNNSYEVLLQRYSNTSPKVSDVSVSGTEDTAIVLLDSVFAAGFSDADGQTLAAIRIVTLPASGALTLDGVAVAPGQEISVADLAAGRLVYRGTADFAGADAFRWTGSDGNVFSTQSVFTNITVNNVNDGPRLEAGPNRVADEGHYFSQSLALGDPDVGNAYRVTVDWGYTQNGNPVTSTFTTTSHTPLVDHYFPDNGSYTVTVTVDDQQGQPNSVETDRFTVTVSNITPTLSLFGDNTVEQGQIYTLSLGNVVDPGADSVTQYSIDWGDGTPPQLIAAADLPASRQLTHSFASAAAVTIVTTVTDEDGSFVAGSKAITVAGPAEVITVDAGSDTSIGEGRLFSRTVSFTDPADQGPAGRSASINWGDGTPVEVITLGAGQFSFNISHVFADDRATPFAVDVTVSDDGFQTATDSFSVGVTNVAPTLALIGDGAVSEGSPYTLTLGPVQDVAADTVSEYRIDWGDGSPLQIVSSAAMPAGRQFEHTYADGATSGTARQIAVTLVDEDGTHLNAAVHPLVVLDVAPTVSTTGAASVAEGALYTLTLGPRVDPGLDSAVLYRIDWGDGSTQNQYTATEYAALIAGGGTVTHRFADGASSPTITVHVFDEDGEHVAASRSVSVIDVAPTATVSGAASVNEGSVYSLSITNLVDPGADTVSSYRIVWGDEASPGDYQLVTAQALAASGGVVQHTYADGAASHVVQVSAANEEGLFALGTQAVTVNNVAPAITVSGAASIAEGGSYTLTLGPRVDPGADTPSLYSIDWGDGTARSEFSPTAYDALVAGGGQLTHVYADGASNPVITVRVTDEDGEHVAAVKDIAVDNVAPTAAVSGAATTAEGSVYNLTVGPITDPGADTRSSYTIAWGDGLSDSFTAAEWTAAAGAFTHTYADGPGNAVITVSTTDEDGSFTLGTQEVAITNVAPTATVSGAATIAEGTLYTLTVGPVADPGADTRSAYTIAWGDGLTDSYTAAEWTAAAGSFTHTYADGPGNAVITVSTTDEDGTTILGTQAVTIDNVAPTATISGAATIAEGSVYTLTVNAVSDPGADTRSAYTIAWGDGLTDSYTAAEWTAAAGSFTHTYADGPGSATITVSTTDEDGSFTLGTQEVAIANVAPTATISGAATIAEGSVYTLTVGAVSDPGADTRSSYTITWGDGSTDSFTAAEWTAAAGAFTHTYADGPGSATITVSTTDEDGSFTLGTQAVTIANVAPTATVSGAATTTEGSPYTLTVGAVSDPGADTRSAYTIAWGDGSTDSFTAAEWTAAAGSFTHTYADGPGNAVITVSTTDEDGSFTLGTQAVTIDNVAPTLAASGAPSATVGVAYTLNLANYLDPGQDSLLPDGITIDWGDGSTSTASGVGNFTHLYTAAGTPTITVSLADEDGTYAAVASLAVSVAPPTPTVAIAAQAAGSVAEGDTFTRSIVFSDGEDSGGDGWTYNVTWNDGVVQTGTTATQSFELTRSAPDGDAALSATITVSDTSGTDSDVENLALTVTNVAPTATVSGAATIAEGTLYTLTVGPVADPGADTRSAYTIAWGDGLSDSFTAAEWTAAAGSFTHTYADGPGNAVITVSTTDEDGSFTLGTQAVTIANVAPTATVSGAATIAEGSLYTLTVGPITDPGADTRSAYTIAWGDGLTDSYTAAEWTAAAGSFTHTYADGPGNAVITVSTTDEDGSFTLGTQAVTIDNVVPTLAASGAPSATVGVAYTLNLANYLDPGQDSLLPGGITIDWGDGSTSTASGVGNFTHLYTAAGTPTITVSLADEDGTYANVASLAVSVAPPTPTVAIAAQAAGSVSEGSSFTRTITFSDGEDSGGDGWTYNVTWNDGVVQTGTTATQSFELTRNAPDGDAALSATLTVSDTSGTDSDVENLALTVTNVAPTATVSGAATIAEGSVYTLTVGAVSDPGADTRSAYTIAWGDGLTDSFTPAEWTAAAGSFTHTYADGSDNATITVSTTDEDGTTILGTQDVTIFNVAPDIDASGAATATVGVAYTLNLANYLDPGQDSLLPDGITINWGDGESNTVNGLGNFTHIYAATGTPTITVSLADEDGTYANVASLAVSVAPPTPTVAIAAQAAGSVSEGDTFTRSIVFSDGEDSGGDGWTYNVTWNDGVVQTGTTATQSFELTRSAPDGDAALSATLTVSDTGGTDSDVENLALTVTNVAPSATVSGAATTTEGSPYTLTVGAVSDPGADTRSAYTIAWGDGLTDSFTAAEWTAAAGAFTHTYADGPGSATITVSTTDEDGSFTLGTQAVTIDNVAPTATISGAATIAEGTLYTLTVGPVADPGADTRSAYTIAWGDGLSDSFTAAEWTAAAGAFTHTYADGPGNAVITVSTTDEDGSFTLGTQAVTIDNVVPTLAASGAPSATVGVAYTLNLANYLDPGQDSLLPGGITIDWGDGSTSTASGLGNFTHLYTATGTPTITVSLADEDGTYAAVASVALSVLPAGGGNTAPVADDDTYTLRPGQTLELPAPGVLDGDTDADGDALTVLSVDTTGLIGSLTQRLDGSLRFTAEAGFTGTTAYTYTVSDGMGGRDTATVTFHVENTAPVAQDDRYSTHAGRPLIVIPGVLGNDADADLDSLFISSFDASGLDGSLDLQADGSFSYTPTAGFTGSTAFTYTVADSFGGSDTAQVVIDVTNTAPVADDEVLHVWRNGSLSLPAPGLLTGDTDADGDNLAVSGVDTTGLSGSLSWNPDGSLLFTPTAGFAGSTGFSYQVADGNGGVDTGHVRIEVLPETTATPIGNAPVRESGLGGQWAAAWTHTGITTLHQHDATNAAEAWTPVAYHAISTSQLAGGDMYGGDLGVSGQSVATSSVRQEIDGSEALRFELATEATGVTVNLSRFFINDDGSLFAESGRLRLLDDSGAVVAETTFQASNAAGTQAVSLAWQDGFSAVELSAGAWDGTDFVFGAYDGGAPIATDAAGKPHGSDFLVDWVEFDFPIVGVPLPPNEV